MSSAPYPFDSDYVNALRRGDPTTETHFADHFNPILLRMLSRKVRCADQARDLRQETLLRVLSIIRCGHGVRKPERFEIFVKKVCHNIVRETYRKQRRFVALTALKDEPATDFPSAYARVLSGEIRGKVRRILSQLDANEQGILEAIFLREQDKDEICRRLGVTRGHLRVLLCRAKKRFRTRVGRDMQKASRRSRVTSLKRVSVIRH
jgi:RNA polymerase sigma-70 factor (ECF subfamily)